MLFPGLAPRVKVLSFGAAHPPQMVRAKLRLNESEELLLVKRLLLQGEEPVALLHIYLPLSMREPADVLRSDEIPIETTFTMWEKAGVHLKGASHTIRAAKAGAEHAKALGIAPGDPILVLDRIVYAQDGRPLEYIMFHYHWQRYEFSVMVPRVNPTPST
jgi:DNA-binding GntR family transcriptional regulator